MLEQLKREVYEANKLLYKNQLSSFIWGNVSGIDRNNSLMVIKPSGMSVADITPDDMVVVDLNGKRVEGKHLPSSDAITHIELYRSFPVINGIAHSHARWSTIFAQMGLGIPALGTTHAEYFNGEIPCTRKLRAYEIRGEYERETGAVIVERFQKAKLSPEEMPGILVCNHGPYTWGKTPNEAVVNSVVMEEVAFMAWHCMALPDRYLVPMQKDLLERHFSRSKHGRSWSEGSNETDSSPYGPDSSLDN